MRIRAVNQRRRPGQVYAPEAPISRGAPPAADFPMRASCQRRHANRMVRLPCFLNDGDRPRYPQALREALMAAGMQLHT